MAFDIKCIVYSQPLCCVLRVRNFCKKWWFVSLFLRPHLLCPYHYWSKGRSFRDSPRTRPHDGKNLFWLRTNGVNTNGAAEKEMNFDRLGKRYALALLGRQKQVNWSTQKKSLCQKHKICSDPISADPICPFPIASLFLPLPERPAQGIVPEGTGVHKGGFSKGGLAIRHVFSICTLN